MPLSAGTRFGPYEILAPLGAGGMGEVYRAKDTKLEREVAIKVLPAALAEDSERLARFEREAKVLASLNHPNIAHIYGVEDRALVMELVPGESLKGPLPLQTALNYAKQIADALEAAHEKGIVHRDLKPANIMITPEGVAKVLDFGLAAVGQSSDPSDPVNSPTLTISPTRAGMILGTAAYMSPEQARGKAVDKRADIWAFGVVLYEMLTGQRLFEGETVSDTLAHVLAKEPDWEQLPAKVRRLLKACLQKDAKQRLQAVGDWRLLLTDEQQPQVITPSRSRLGWIAAVLCLLAGMLAGLIFFWFWEKPAASPERVQLQFLPPAGNRFQGFTALSPDGRNMAFLAIGSDRLAHLWIRNLASGESRLLPRTEGAQNPFWSPDSRALAFYANGELQKIDASGGPVEDLCSSEVGIGGSWNQDGVIVFGSRTGVMRVSANGGDPAPVTKVDPAHGEVRHNSPVFLPDGRRFLYVRSAGVQSGIYVGSLDATPEKQSGKLLLRGQVGSLFAPSRDPGLGYLLFLRDEVLMAQRFDTRQLEVLGEAVPIAGPVSNNGTAGLFSVSVNGMLSYSSTVDAYSAKTELRWFDRSGNTLGALGQPGFHRSLSISPDGTRAAVDRHDADGTQDIWIFEFARNVSTRFTFGRSQNAFAAWSPDGSRLAFYSDRDGINGLYLKPTNGTGAAKLLRQSSGVSVLTDWSKDGRFLLYSANDSTYDSKSRLWVLPVDGSRKPEPFIQTQFNEAQGRFSPDSKRIAYTSDESGTPEVYVQSFPASATGGKWIVSSGGGSQPHWRGDSKELFYLAGDDRFMAVDISTAPVFKAGIPKVLFQVRLYGGADRTRHRWDVTADGKKFLIDTDLDSAPSPITIVLNWQAGLKK